MFLTSKCRWRCGKPGTSIHYWWECNRYGHFEKQLGEFLFFFILSQFRRQESEIRVSVGLALKEDPLHPLLPVSGGYGQFLTFFSYGCITPVSPLVFTWPCSLCLCVSFSQFGSFLKFKHKFIIRPGNYTSTHHLNEMKTQVNTETCLQMLIIASVIITPDWNIQIAIGW